MKSYAKLIVAKPYTEEKPALSKKNCNSALSCFDKSSPGKCYLDIWVRAKAPLIRNIPTAFYMTCYRCGEKHDSDTVGFRICLRCHRKQYIRPKASFKIEISDATASMVVLIEGKYAETLFDFSAFAVWKNQRKLNRHDLREAVRKVSPPAQLTR